MDDESLIADTGEQPVEQSNNQEPAQSWKWNDELGGEGDAPEWLKTSKYGSVAEQAKAYTELEKRFGSFTGAPEEYELPEPKDLLGDVELPEGVDMNLAPDDPLLVRFMGEAKEMGINQEGFNKLVGLYVQQQANDYADSLTSAADEKKMLGDNADARLKNLADWGKSNLDEDMFGKYVSALTTAAAVEVIEHLVQKTRNSKLPNPADIQTAPAFTKADYDEAMNKRGPNGEWLYQTDPAYRAKVQKMGEQIFGKEPNRQIMG